MSNRIFEVSRCENAACKPAKNVTPTSWCQRSLFERCVGIRAAKARRRAHGVLSVSHARLSLCFSRSGHRRCPRPAQTTVPHPDAKTPSGEQGKIAPPARYTLSSLTAQRAHGNKRARVSSRTTRWCHLRSLGCRFRYSSYLHRLQGQRFDRLERARCQSPSSWRRCCSSAAVTLLGSR